MKRQEEPKVELSFDKEQFEQIVNTYLTFGKIRMTRVAARMRMAALPQLLRLFVYFPETQTHRASSLTLDEARFLLTFNGISDGWRDAVGSAEVWSDVLSPKFLSRDKRDIRLGLPAQSFITALSEKAMGQLGSEGDPNVWDNIQGALDILWERSSLQDNGIHEVIVNRAEAQLLLALYGVMRSEKPVVSKEDFVRIFSIQVFAKR